jgi:ferredoxin
MDIASIVEGPLLEVVFILFALGLLVRAILFLTSVFRSDKSRKMKWRHILPTILGSLLPLHRTFVKKPIYTTIRTLFHICLFVVPLFFYGHIVLWESSWLELSWTSIPDVLADWMSILFIGLSLFFLLRRILVSDLRKISGLADYLLLLIGATTFLSGYFLTHGTLDHIPFFLDHLQTLHIFIGEVMILMVIFLFLASYLDKKKCTGCAACESSCPTGTLEYRDQGNTRTFSHSHYLCISCGACIGVCPEDAARLKHNISLKRLFQLRYRLPIRTVELQACQSCGTLFAPEMQLDRIARLIRDDYVFQCSRCKMVNTADQYLQLIPELKSQKGEPGD